MIDFQALFFFAALRLTVKYFGNENSLMVPQTHLSWIRSLDFIPEGC
jgi:hypothetical protein